MEYSVIFDRVLEHEKVQFVQLWCVIWIYLYPYDVGLIIIMYSMVMCKQCAVSNFFYLPGNCCAVSLYLKLFYLTFTGTKHKVLKMLSLLLQLTLSKTLHKFLSTQYIWNRKQLVKIFKVFGTRYGKS